MKNLFSLITTRSLLLFFLLTGCQAESIPETSSNPNNGGVTESQLILSNAILEQANPAGQTLWRVKSVETKYSPDRQFAYLEGVTGNYWQNQELAIYLTAEKGQVIDDGEIIILTDNVIITDVRNQTVITGDELTWYTQKNLLILKGNLVGEHPQFNVTALMGKYYTDTQQLELSGDVVGYSQESPLKFSSNELLWQIESENILVNSPVEIVRYDEQAIITEKITSEKLEVDLDSHQAKFSNNVEFISFQPAVQIASNSLIWYYQERRIIADEPLKIVHHEEELTLIANQGELDLVTEIAHLSNGVQGKTPRNQANLYSQELTWAINTQIVEARGNVVYEQIEPDLHLRGDKAIGTLQDNNIVVTGNEESQIITDIKW